MFGWLRGNTIRREIIINCERLEMRVAIMENGKLEEFLVEHPTQERIVGSIYKGRIQNLEHDLQAAFVDIGLKKNAFLHYWDMVPDDMSSLEMEETGGPRNRPAKGKRFSNEEIERRFRPGSEIVVQVTKGPIGTKGPRVTASLSIPGRYLVMVPGAQLRGVSRKIGDAAERERLRKVLNRLPLPPDTGLIVRTVAAGARKRSFARDLKSLTVLWRDLQLAIAEKHAPACLHQEPDLVERVVRDWITEDIDRIVIDSPPQYDKIREMTARISRRTRSRIHLYEGDLPVFDHYNVERQLAEAFGRKVMLKSGGYVVLDETEAMIAIDVNTGRHKGKGSQEDAILAVNMEAVEEVARQLRLRNVGGLVVIDLIDMKSKKHRNAVYRELRTYLKRDRARTNVLPISDLGMIEMTRQRFEESIMAVRHIDCPYCHGRGTVKSPLSMSVDIQRQVSTICRRNRKAGKAMNLQVVVHPTVLDRLRREDEDLLVELESEVEGRLSFKSDPAKHVEYFSVADTVTGEMLYASME